MLGLRRSRWFDSVWWLSHASRRPLAISTFAELRENLRSLCGEGGEFDSGDRFLTERETAERYGVSRPTANKALAALVGEGLLEFRRGVGTFVRGGRLDLDLRQLVSFTEKCLAAGWEPETRVLAFRTARASKADEGVAAALGVDDREPLLAMTRLRLADGEPLILERRHVVKSYCEDLTRADAKGSLYGLWEDYYELPITGADQTLTAVNARPDEAANLGAKRGAAVMCVEAVGLLSGERPLWHERTLYRGDAWLFVGRLAGPGDGRPAVAGFSAEA